MCTVHSNIWMHGVFFLKGDNMITREKRAKMEKLIWDYFMAMDKSGQNANRYKEFFAAMSDTQFDSWFKEFFEQPDDYVLVLDTLDYKNDITMEDIEDGAKVLDIPLFETFYDPHLTMDKDRVIATKEPVPVGYLHIKRPQQTVAKKNGISTNIDKRSAVTGQVSGKDKNGRDSDIESSMLVTLGMEKTLKELNGFRADDLVAKQQALQGIYAKGYLTLDELDDDPANKTTLNTVNAYLLGMCLNSDLITKGSLLRKNIT